MPRSRTQKQVARRIDIFYFRSASGMRNLRRGLIAICTLGALAWIGIAAARSSGTKSPLNLISLTSLHNPGHLARPHARFENDCAKCHQGEQDAWGHYRLKVTDEACLQCHDAAIHRQNQKKSPGDGAVSREAIVLAISDEHHPGGARSAGCVDCHTEHRGDAALIGMHDSNCVLCHANLKAAATQPSLVPDSINVTTAFALDTHPRFGRQITTASKMVDPTKLKFDHKFHYPKMASAGVENPAQTCVFCHNSGTENRVEIKPDPDRKTSVPPFATNKVTLASAGRNGDSGYMMPITYSEQCSGCHPMNVGDDLKISHIAMSEAVKQLATVTQAQLAKLAVMSDDDRKAALTPAPAESSGGGGRGRKKASSDAPADAKPISANLWVKQQIDWLKSPDWIDNAGLPDEAKTALKTAATNDDLPTEALLSAYLAWGMDTSCGKCHDISVKQDGDSWKIETEPTGIPATPRHWFANSRFDHRPHRDIGCVDCHKGALESGQDDPLNNTIPAAQTSTADVLSPDMDGTYMGNKKLEEQNTCIHCHNSTGSPAAVASSCTSCHVYHDRTKERMVSASIAK
jgi:hypothetical protein